MCAVLGTLLYAGQLVSSVNFPLAQCLGFQEQAEHADPLASRLELGTARWDSVSLWVIPVAGILMTPNHSGWPDIGLIGSGVCVDAGGCEGAQVRSLREQGVGVGPAKERRLAFKVFTCLMILGGLMIGTSLAELN